jgi:DNA-binding transcriptional ArsR family regulator
MIMSAIKKKELKNNSEELAEVLSELRTYSRIMAACAMSQRARAVIDTYKKAQTYANLDGSKSDKEKSEIVSVPRRTVSSWVEEFVRHGLVEKKGYGEKTLFTLEELGIQLNELKKAEKSTRRRLAASEASKK